MEMGKVTAIVPTLRTAACLEQGKFLLVEVAERVIAAGDLVGAYPGDRVLVATGFAAGRMCMDAPLDAAVVAILPRDGKN